MTDKDELAENEEYISRDDIEIEVMSTTDEEPCVYVKFSNFADMEDAEEFDSEEDEDGMDMDQGGEDGIEDRVMDLEDALDELKAEFDALMAGEEAEEDARRHHTYARNRLPVAPQPDADRRRGRAFHIGVAYGSQSVHGSGGSHAEKARSRHRRFGAATQTHLTHPRAGRPRSVARP